MTARTEAKGVLASPVTKSIAKGNGRKNKKTSIYRGVSFCNDTKRFLCHQYDSASKKPIHIGYFDKVNYSYKVYVVNVTELLYLYSLSLLFTRY